MTDSLTTSEVGYAAAQGWQLVIVYDTRGYFASAVLPTTNSPLPHAGAAQSFVWDRAKAGDRVCRRALAIVTASELAGKSKTAKKGKQ